MSETIVVPIYWFRSLSSFEFSMQTIDISISKVLWKFTKHDESIVCIENSKEESDLNQ